jgi:transcriptional regulator with XRE-family HTH domain
MVLGVKRQAPTGKETQDAGSISKALGTRIQMERQKRNWTIQELADRSGISRAMISKIERIEASPTAVTISRLGVAFGLSMSSLLSEGVSEQRLVRASEQQLWADPATGYIRKAVSPPSGLPLQLVEVCLPARKKIGFPALSYEILHQQIWVLEGALTFHECEEIHHLSTGDCLQLVGAKDCIFENRSRSTTCRYVVALIVGR